MLSVSSSCRKYACSGKKFGIGSFSVVSLWDFVLLFFFFKSNSLHLIIVFKYHSLFSHVCLSLASSTFLFYIFNPVIVVLYHLYHYSFSVMEKIYCIG